MESGKFDEGLKLLDRLNACEGSSAAGSYTVHHILQTAYRHAGDVDGAAQVQARPPSPIAQLDQSLEKAEYARVVRDGA